MGKDPQGKGDSLIRSSSSKSSSSSYSSSSLSSSSYFASRVSLLDNTSAGYECCVACEELSNSSTFFRRSSGPRTSIQRHRLFISTVGTPKHRTLQTGCLLQWRSFPGPGPRHCGRREGQESRFPNCKGLSLGRLRITVLELKWSPGEAVLGDCWIDFGILKEVGTWEWGWGVVHCGGYRRKKRAAEWWADWRRGRSLSVLLQLPSIKASEATSDVARSLEAVLLRRDHCEKMRLRPEEIFFAAVRCRY
nr:hypothetical protein Itr_chr05CG12610 [Ipomoea trifida]